MLTTTEGIVISERTQGENDKFISILSPTKGIIEIMVRGAKKLNSKSGSSAQMFAYAKYCYEQKNDRNYLNSCELISSFYELRLDMARLALASYFAEVLRHAVTSGQSAKDVMRLMLNCLHFLCTGERSCEFIKCVFELRLLSEIGMQPDLLCCRSCCEYLTEEMYFVLEQGVLLCSDCYNGYNAEHVVKMNTAVVHALRYVTLVEFNKIFSFRLADKSLAGLARISEEYLLLQLGRGFKTLDFYKSVK